MEEFRVGRDFAHIAARILVSLYLTESRQCIECGEALPRFFALDKYDILMKKRFR